MNQGSLPTPPDIQGQVLALKAASVSITQIAKTLGISTWTVRQLSRTPEAKAFITGARQALKEQASAAILEHGPLLDKVIMQALKGFDPSKVNAKDLDALFRAAAASEKRSSSISGENRVVQQPAARVTVTFQPWAGGQTIDAQTGKEIEPAELVAPPPALPPAPATADDDEDQP